MFHSGTVGRAVSTTPPRSNGRWLRAGTAALLLGLAALAAVRLWPEGFSEPQVRAPLDPACDLQRGPCTGTLPQGRRIELLVQPRPIPLLQPLELEVRLTGIDASRVEVDFSGVDMYMGYNRPTLQRGADGVYRGRTILPVCVRHRMRWEATVLAAGTGSGGYAAPFRFGTHR